MYLHLLAVVPIPPHEARTIFRLWRKDIELHCKKSLCCIVCTIYVTNFYTNTKTYASNIPNGRVLLYRKNKRKSRYNNRRGIKKPRYLYLLLFIPISPHV